MTGQRYQDDQKIARIARLMHAHACRLIRPHGDVAWMALKSTPWDELPDELREVWCQALHEAGEELMESHANELGEQVQKQVAERKAELAKGNRNSRRRARAELRRKR